MPILKEWNLTIDIDQVLRCQGADPVAIRARSPKLVELAEQVVDYGSPLLTPRVLFRRMVVKSVLHERIMLEDGTKLRGPLLARLLAPATEVLVILCTIGAELENTASEKMKADPLLGLALDGLGSAAVEELANAACRRFELEAKESQLKTSIPLSPGMIDWPVEEGQPQIFNLLRAEDIGVSHTPAWVMLPRKSLSMVIGVGKQMVHEGTTCEYCSMRETCRYQEHYA